jgi:hypothetical protein
VNVPPLFTESSRSREVETVDTEKLTEIVWCDHLRVTTQPLVMSKVPHVFLHGDKSYLVIEMGKVKLVCPECFYESHRSLRLPFS